MAIIYFSVVFVVFLTSLLQFGNTFTLASILGLLALLAKLVEVYLLFWGEQSGVYAIPIFSSLSLGCFLGLFFGGIYQEKTDRAGAMAIKISLIVGLLSFMVRAENLWILNMAIILISWPILFQKKSYLVQLYRGMNYFVFFFLFSLMAQKNIFLGNMGLLFEFIGFFFYYKIIHQLILKYNLCKKLQIS